MTFFTPVFYWILSDTKSPQVSRTLLSILVDLNSLVVWMVLLIPVITNSSSLFSEPLQTNPSAPNIIGITSNLTFFISLTRSKYFFNLLLFYLLWFTGTAKSIRWQVFFLLFNARFGLLGRIWGSISISKSQIILCFLIF